MCRIPLSTCHSQIAKWCGNKPRVLVLNRVDMVSERDKASWTRHFNAAGTHVCWTDGVSGLGTGQVPLLYPVPPWEVEIVIVRKRLWTCCKACLVACSNHLLVVLWRARFHKA